MGWSPRRNGAARRATAVCAALAALLTSSPRAAAQSDGQELLDRAIESLEFRDDDAYEQAVEDIATSGQWFPSTLEQALDERDFDLIIMVWFVIDAPDNDVLQTAMDIASFERDGLAFGDPNDSLDRDQLERVDRQGLTALETIEHRGLSTTGAITTALSLLPDDDGGSPDPSIYDSAIGDLAAVIAGAPVTPADIAVEGEIVDDQPTAESDSGTGNASVSMAEIEILEDALAALRAELAVIERMPDGTAPSDDLRTELTAADGAGISVLARANDAGIGLSPEAIFVLERLPEPDGTAQRMPADYERAIELIEFRLQNPSSPRRVVSSDDSTTVETPVADVSANVATNDGNAPAISVPSTSSGAGSTVPWIAVAGISLAAIVMGLFALRRSREAVGLADLANTDGLTGLHNRRKFDADIDEHRLRGNAPVAMLMVDVDRFKNFNDVHGHSTGDEVLRLVAEALANSIRRHDVAYRYGGEEFCALLPGTYPEEAQHVAERIRTAIEDIDLPVDAHLTASVGLASGASSQLDVLIEHADAALYSAKAAGRNRVVSA